jgi:rhamnosyltransferase
MFAVSVLIRNRNEGEHLYRLLTRLRQQHGKILEIVVVDNESTDASRHYAQEFGCRLVDLPAKDFTYGRATNLGIEACKGDLVLMLSAHSLPLGNYFINEVTPPFSNPEVAAVRIPIAANTRELGGIVPPPLNAESSIEEIFRRGPVASGCVIRRNVWLQHRFDETLGAAEDKEWAARVLRSGNYIMPAVQAAYCYNRSFGELSWIQKLEREETAGLIAGNIKPRVSLKTTVFSILAAQRDAMRKARLEAHLYFFRTRLSRKAMRNTNSVEVKH